MPVFRYKARDREGVLISGEIEAASADELRQGLFNEGMIPIDVVEVRLRLTPGKGIGSFMQRVKPEDILMFTRQFHTLFKAGVTVDKIFSSLARQARKDAMRNALLMIRADVASGASLAKAFSKHPRLFNELYVSMLAAGEEAGILDDVLGNLSDLLEKDFTIQKNIKGAVLYPKIVIVVLVCAVVFLMTFVVPKFVGFYGHYYAQLPLPTRILIAISDFFKSYWYIALGAVVAIYYGYKSYYKSK
jgi:type IV pilus assembly protein PilC